MNELNIIHHEDSFVVVNKPSGMLSVPGRGPEMQDSVVSRVKELVLHCTEHPAVHRLDMDTAGLMVLGLTKESQRHLTMQFQERRVEKTYHAVLQGVLAASAGEIELAFRLDPDNRPHQIYDPVQGKRGLTKWRKLDVYEGCTLVEFTPLTGRTHQLRLHAAHELGLGIPIVGDRLYGTGTAPGQLKLQAVYLAFDHPVSGVRQQFSVEPLFRNTGPPPQQPTTPFPPTS